MFNWIKKIEGLIINLIDILQSKKRGEEISMLKVINQFNLKDKRVLIRADFNIPLKDGKVLDDARIKATLPTIQYAIDQKAKVILASHMGRPKGEPNPKYSLLPVAEHLSMLLKKDIIFPEDCIGSGVKKLVSNMREGEIMLLENLRFHAEEEKNDSGFAEKLASLADIYINDAFGMVHRAHASTCAIAQYFDQKGVGFLMKNEFEVMVSLLKNPQKPYLTILGGAKVSDKIMLIENLINHTDTILVGGAMAYTFLKARGVKVGKSLVEDSKIHLAEKLLMKAEMKGVKIFLPVDSVVTKKIEEGAVSKVMTIDEDWGDFMGVDIGPKTLELFQKKVNEAKTIFWNGPMGVYEVAPFHQGTFELARMISKHDAFSVVGGGDSLAVISQTGLQNKFGHLSTGGGASMEFLEGKSLPGLQALKQLQVDQAANS